MKISGFAVAAVAGLATCLSIGAAKADELTFGPGTDVTWNGIPNLGVVIQQPAQNANNAGFDGGTGTWTLAAFNALLQGFVPPTFTNFPNNSEAFTANVTGGTAGCAPCMLAGNITWTALVDDNPFVDVLVGTLHINTSSGSTTWDTLFPAGAALEVHWNINGLGGGETLATLVGPATATSSNGEIQGVPGPIVGAGLPGLIAALGGLVAMVRRRRKQLA